MIPKRGTDKGALITGASRGIGRAIAERFGAEGYHVVATDLESQAGELEDLATAIRDAGGTCSTVFGDVGDPDSIQDIARQAIATAGQIHVLVNNAGILSIFPVEEIKAEEWDRIYRVNVRGLFLLCQAMLDHLEHAGNGKIVNIASIGGKRGGPGQAHYCSSKASVISFTHILAQEVAKRGIRVNAVCPGIIDTVMGRNNYPDTASLKAIEEKTALGRLGYPADVAGAVSFFASNDADFITGQALNVDGGIIYH